METKRIFLFTKLNVNFTQINRFLQYKPIETENKIQIAHKMTRIIDRKRFEYEKKQAQIKKISGLKRYDHLIISCKKQQFNHYYGVTYGKNFKQEYLASFGWANRNSNGDYFTINPYGSHPSLNLDENFESFKDLNMSEKIVNVLRETFDVTKPTNIQILSLEKIMQSNKHYLIVAETGCGKTLCYVLPIIEDIIKFKEENKTHSPNSPIGMVIVPTRELAFQLYEVFKKFSDNLNIRVVLDIDEKLVSLKEKYMNYTIDHTLNDTKPDVIITMTSRLKEKFRQNKNYISSINLKKLVIDEANLLLDDSNNISLIKVLNYLNLNLSIKDLNKNYTQLLFVSATIPKDMRNILNDIVDVDSDEFERITTKNVNRLMLHVPQKFYRLSSSAKKEKLMEIVKRDMLKTKYSLMIFSNKVNTAMFVQHFLRENDVDSVLFHSGLSDDERENTMARFLSGRTKIMSCTDIASRGLDTIHVNHVINYEFPTFIADYVHRIGRVGRIGSTAGSNCKITNFISKGFEVNTVWNIESSIRKASDLDNLNANITRILANKYTPKHQFNNKPINTLDNQIEKNNEDNNVELK